MIIAASYGDKLFKLVIMHVHMRDETERQQVWLKRSNGKIGDFIH